MASDVSVANDALTTYVGVGSIMALDEKSPEARICRQQLPGAVRDVLAAFQWPRARAVADLVRVVTPATSQWTYAFALPADLVMIWRVEGYDRTPTLYELAMHPDFSRDDQILWAQAETLRLVYSSSRTPINSFSPGMLELLAIRLAAKVVMPLKKDAKLRLSLEDQFTRRLAALSTIEANSEPELIEVDFIPEFIRARI